LLRRRSMRFSWSELMTTDLDAGWSFYEKVFG
jgi:predicted enzyme related to lactoylglutathione lyase